MNNNNNNNWSAAKRISVINGLDKYLYYCISFKNHINIFMFSADIDYYLNTLT